MKRIYVLRHANWDFLGKDQLNPEGIGKCKEVAKKLPKFDLVISSNRDPTIETAKILSGKEPKIDDRAGELAMTEEQVSQFNEIRKTHPCGAIGALLAIPELHGPLKIAGEKLVSLIKEIFARLQGDGNALITSHEGTMIRAEKVIEGKDIKKPEKNYDEAEGFVIDENLNIKEFLA